MKKVLTISVIINILFFLFGGYIIHRRGSVGYLKKRFLKETIHRKPLIDYSIYHKSKQRLFEIMPNDTNEIIFLGNSITANCDWSEFFGNPNIKNRGIGGDVIIGIIDRLDEVIESNPKKIFLMIGINELGGKNPTRQTLMNYEKLIILIREKSPNTKLYVQSILPTSNSDHGRNSDVIIIINKGLENLTKKYNCIYINLFDLFKTEKNKLDINYTFDGVHLNSNGYLLWKSIIKDYVNN